MSFHVQSQADDTGVGSGFLAEIVKEGAEDARAAKVRMDVDGLQPPDVAVAPITPLERVQELTDDATVDAGDEIASFARVIQHGFYARLDVRAVQLFPFRLGGETAIEIESTAQ